MRRALAPLLAALALTITACAGPAATPRATGAASAPAGTGTPAAATGTPAAPSSAAATSAAPSGSPSAPPSESPTAGTSESPTAGTSESPTAGTSESPTAGTSESPTAGTSGSPSGNAADFVACEVSDTGGINDKGFNQNAYKGLTDAQAELGIAEPQFLESTADADYARNIQTFIDQGCDIIVTVGFLLGTATQEAATANPEQKFGIVDFAYDPPLQNVTGIVFKMDEPSMLAGYLAAGMSTTDTVATFGGIDIPPVTEFMDGFAAGVNYWNEQKGENVQLLGRESFVGNFSDTAAGNQLAQGFIQENADVIFAVAGPVGLGAMAAVQDANKGASPEEMVKFIGVDVDQTETAPEYTDILMTSVLKRIDNGVKAVVQSALEGTFEGGVQLNTLETEGTGLAPYHEFEDDVPDELKQEIETLQQAIISGEVVPSDWYEGAPG